MAEHTPRWQRHNWLRGKEQQENNKQLNVQHARTPVTARHANDANRSTLVAPAREAIKAIHQQSGIISSQGGPMEASTLSLHRSVLTVDDDVGVRDRVGDEEAAAALAQLVERLQVLTMSKRMNERMHERMNERLNE